VVAVTDWVDHILSVLQSGSLPEQSEALLRAMFFFEKALGRPDCCWPDDVVTEKPTEEKVSRLRDGLARFVAAHLRPPPVASALSALSVLRDPSLRDLFRRCLEENAHAGPDMGLLYSAMIALDNLGEQVFPLEHGRGHASLTEYERNLRLAVAYLKRGEA
jgi:hypothetical protein